MHIFWFEEGPGVEMSKSEPELNECTTKKIDLH
jgi:hypothetical protein